MLRIRERRSARGSSTRRDAYPVSSTSRSAMRPWPPASARRSGATTTCSRPPRPRALHRKAAPCAASWPSCTARPPAAARSGSMHIADASVGTWAPRRAGLGCVARARSRAVDPDARDRPGCRDRLRRRSANRGPSRGANLAACGRCRWSSSARTTSGIDHRDDLSTAGGSIAHAPRATASPGDRGRQRRARRLTRQGDRGVNRARAGQGPSLVEAAHRPLPGALSR